MKTICAWCQTPQELPDVAPESPTITHGICESCANSINEKAPETISRLLDGLDQPIFLVDSAGRIQGANAQGRTLVNKPLESIENCLGGEVFECSYAAVGDGCGQTEHCRTCAIRNTVQETLRTGKSVHRVPAYQSIEGPGGRTIIRFSISTQRVGSRVLLRIDEASPTDWW